MSKHNYKSFLKWVGGKSKLLSVLDSHFPDFISKNKPFIYVESFLGGGAVFFHIIKKYNVQKAYLNDVNRNLINTYKDIKENVEDLIVVLQKLEGDYKNLKSVSSKKKFFLKARKGFNQMKKSVKKSAYLIFLNKTCFNGIYRENLKGEFNTPFGDMKNPKICDKELLLKLFKLFNSVEIVFSAKKFECILIKKTDFPIFYYLDPPYRPISKTSSFTGYSSESIFTDSSQYSLKKYCDKIDKRGGFFMQSNSYSADKFFQNLYSNRKVGGLSVTRTISASASKRVSVKELLIKNY